MLSVEFFVQRIVSVSRCTDVPSFYPQWFKKRLQAGYAGWENPFGSQKYLVSLKPEDVLAFVFWSKDYRPFFQVLPELQKKRYNCLFHYTITGLPQVFETNLGKTEENIECFKELSFLFSPEQVFWRYDSVLISDLTERKYHLSRFSYLASCLAGYTRRCYISFPVFYQKIKSNCIALEENKGIRVLDPKIEEKIELARSLAGLANKHGIELYSCCGEYLISKNIKKGSCIDGSLLSRLFSISGVRLKKRPTRKECGCTESTDIGKYNTCLHRCILNYHLE